MSIVNTRRSCREFKDDKLSRDLLMDLVRSGGLAPSARNQQPWEFVIIDDENLIKELSEVSAGAGLLKRAPSCIAVVKKVDTIIPEFADIDCSAAVCNIMLRACELEIGSCWIGIHPIPKRTGDVNKLLHIPTGKSIFALIALGYPSNPDIFKEVQRTPKVVVNRYA